MKKLILFLCLLTQAGFAQTYKIDSLKRELRSLNKQPNGYGQDTLRYQTLKDIMYRYADINVDSSMHYNTLMIRLCQARNLQKELTYTYQFAGYLYLIKGDYDQSILFHYRVLPLAEKFKQYTRLARSYGALAHAYTSLDDYEKAKHFCQKGESVLKRHSDITIQLSIQNVWGELFRKQGKLKDALKVCQDMYKLAKHDGIQWYEAQGLHKIGWIYKEMGDKTRPLDYYRKALAMSHKIGSVDLEGNILLHIAEVYIQQKKWSKAIAYCNWAKQTTISLKNSSILKETEEIFYKIFKETVQPAKALKSYEKFVFLKDSLSKVENQQRTDLLQAQYDNVQTTIALQRERLQRQAEQSRSQQLAQTRNGLFFGITAILLVTTLLFWSNRRLQAKNQEIDQQRILLETARGQLTDINKTLETRVEQRTAELVTANRKLIRKNEEIKEALFKGQTIERKRVALELHDNLSSLLSAVNMSIQAINPQHLSVFEQSVYRNVKQLIQNAYAEVRNISHNILPAELEREGLVITLTKLIEKLNQSSLLEFSLMVKDLNERLPVEIEFNLYSIVLELINNAIKHAKATTIEINLIRTKSGIKVSVIDDGIGLNKKQENHGVGLQNIQSRLDSLGGAFSILLPAQKGTQIEMNIPIETAYINGDAQIS